MVQNRLFVLDAKIVVFRSARLSGMVAFSDPTVTSFRPLMLHGTALDWKLRSILEWAAQADQPN